MILKEGEIDKGAEICFTWLSEIGRARSSPVTEPGSWTPSIGKQCQDFSKPLVDSNPS